MEKKKDSRCRNWSFVFYPESCPADWADRIAEAAIPCAVSPLHDKDVNPDGEIKKSHYHAILAFEGNKSYEQALSVAQMIGGDSVNTVKRVDSMKGYIRYFIHLDNPEKFQYSKSDIRSFGGFCADDYFTLSSAQEIQIIAEIEDFIEEANITEYWDLVRACRRDHFEDWYPVVIKKATLHLNAAIRSRRNKLSKPIEKKPWQS